ncbi:hypothetical protein OKW43_006474 [Paraburkholderia sp. WC7.3g]|uniref:C-glycoside deglycosidase beta subunit domain-containing protein n=1 Tax=Paraburkholderia sp. WC7.3g TaxID=2991070 RepID=UPI003D216FD7
MSAANRLFGSDELRIDASGTGAIKLRLPWYRSLAPSTIEDVSVSVNGKIVPRSDVIVEINGRGDRLDAIADRWQETWFVQDRAIVRFPLDAPLEQEAAVSATLTIRIPYILTGPDSAMSRAVSETRKLTVVKEEQR